MYCVYLPIDGGPTSWQAKIAGSVQERVELGRHTTYRVGGPTRYLVVPAIIDDVVTVFSSGEAVFVIGAGSNILASDKGYGGVVLKIMNAVGHVSLEGDEIVVGAGRPLASLVRACVEMGYSGLEWAVNIPGTVGGAVCTNAGAFGSSMWEHVRYADVVTPGGETHRFGPGDVAFSYRRAAFPVPKPFAVTEIGMGLEASTADAVGAVTAGYKLRRESSQPVGAASAGCVFKNPSADVAAGALIDRAGLKGLRRGAAAVSEKHANFVVNEGGASAADIYGLIQEVRTRVKDAFGVELELEIELLGEFDGG